MESSRRKRRLCRLLTCLLGLALCNSLVLAQTVMTNATVIKMTKAGLTENVIISSIDSHPGNYSTDPDDLIALKTARVSDKVIAAIIAKATGASSAPSQPIQSTASSPNAPNSQTSSDSRIASGVVEAEIGNGDLKPARFAKLFVIPAQNAGSSKKWDTQSCQGIGGCAGGCSTARGSERTGREHGGDTVPRGPHQNQTLANHRQS